MPTIAPELLFANDFVQARKTSDNEPMQVAEGVMAADGTTTGITMGTMQFTVADGWNFELIHRDIVFPDALSEITATFRDGTVKHLMGKADTWMDESGVRVNTGDILIIT